MGKKITQLPYGAFVNGADQYPAVQNGVTKRFYMTNVLQWIKLNLTPGDIGAQSRLTFDDYPAIASNNPVKSDGIAQAIYDSEDLMMMAISVTAFSSLPKTISNADITARHRVLRVELGSPRAQVGTWTFTTASGSVTVSGSISGSTTMLLILGYPASIQA
jgi:hypothetical protein